MSDPVTGAAEARVVLRRCVSCRALRDRRLLWRLIRLSGGGIALDRGMGRSAYLCPSHSCLDEARRRRRLARGLRCAVPDSVLDTLASRLEQAGAQSLRQDERWPSRAGGPVACHAAPAELFRASPGAAPSTDPSET